MPEDKVTFKANGDYTIGAPLQEMDVHREQGTPGETGAEAPTAAAAPKSKVGKAAGPQRFDMSKLRKNAGVKKAAKPKDPPPEETPLQPAPPPKRTKKEKAPEPPKEDPKPAPAPEPVPAPIPESEGTHISIPPELMDPPPVHIPGGDPPIPAPDSKEFKLHQLGVTNRPGEEDPPTEEPAPEPPKEPVQKLELGTLGRGKKDNTAKAAQAASESVPAPVEPEVQPTPTAPSEEPVTPEPAPATPKVTEMNLGKVSEGPTPAGEDVPETAETAPEFIFHTLDEFLALTGLEVQDLSTFSKAVVRAMLRGGSIWQSKKNPMLRAYSCVVPTGRSTPRGVRYLFTVGWDVHVTSCYVDQNHLVTDGSANLKCEGICAFVQGTPVALSLERKRDAVVV